MINRTTLEDYFSALAFGQLPIPTEQSDRGTPDTGIIFFEQRVLNSQGDLRFCRTNLVEACIKVGMSPDEIIGFIEGAWTMDYSHKPELVLPNELETVRQEAQTSKK